ncbi:hypothetical protein [Algimonas arctica]|nr:hypothetical protein [Algimonas arctica]
MAALPVSSSAQSSTAPSAFEVSDNAKDQGWKNVIINLSWRGNAVSKAELGITKPAEVVYSGTADTPGNIVFNCYNGRPSVSFAILPIDMRGMMTEPPDSRRMKLKRPKISIDGVRIKGEDWIYMPAMKVYRARRIGSFKALYNATILGSDVRVKAGSDNIQLNVPPADDVFKDFGATCGIGRLAKR